MISRERLYAALPLLVAIVLLPLASWAIIHQVMKMRQEHADRVLAELNKRVIIEWEVDKKYGEKRTTLPNGLKLFVYRVEATGPDVSTSTETTWGWTVGTEGLSEREAMDRALQMGGVK